MEKCNKKNKNIFTALNEAVAALGDIPAKTATAQQKAAYKLCVEERDKLFATEDTEVTEI